MASVGNPMAAAKISNGESRGRALDAVITKATFAAEISSTMARFEVRLCLMCVLAMSGSAMARAGVAFSLVTAFTLDRPWLETETGLLGLSIGVQGIAAYAARHTYNFQPVFTRPSDDEHINWARVRKTVQLFTGQGSNLMCQSDWVVWVESDTWITNQHILLENIVALANDSNPDFAAIVNRDYAGNLNTGVAFIRCSHEGLVLMHALLQCKEQNRTHHLVKAWDHNGCMMLLHGNPRYRDLIAFVPPKACNAYPIIDYAQGSASACDGSNCY